MDLIRKFQKGDKKSFESIFEQLYHRLFAYSYKYLAEQELAEDVVQESFVKLWDQREQFDHLLAIKSFLYTTARNKCLNELRHQSVRQKHEPQLIHEIESAAIDPQLVEEEYYGMLYAEIRKLPPASQKMMLLFLQGLKNKEVAEQLGISENTVKTQKKLAYAKLKQSLSSEMFGFLLAI